MIINNLINKKKWAIKRALTRRLCSVCNSFSSKIILIPRISTGKTLLALISHRYYTNESLPVNHGHGQGYGNNPWEI